MIQASGPVTRVAVGRGREGACVPSALDADRAAALAAVKRRKLELLRLYPSARYVPTGVIGDWIDAVGAHDLDSGRVVTYLHSGCNGGGKTRGLSEMIAASMRGPQSPWLDRPLFCALAAKRPRLRLVSTEQALKEGALRELRDLLAADLEPGYPRREGCEWDAAWRTRNGSHLEVLTWQQSILTHAGASIDALFRDEPGPRPIAEEDEARLRHGGPIVWGMTPYDPSQNQSHATIGWVFDAIRRSEELGDGTYVVHYGDAEDSCIEHGIRGRVPHQVIEDRARRWMSDPATFAARFSGRFALELGRVLPFDRERNVFDPETLVVHPGWDYYAHLDVHEARPHVFVFAVLDPFGVLWVLHEIQSGAGPAELAKEIKSVYAAYGVPRVALIDPLGETSNPLDPGNSLARELRRLGLDFRSAGAQKAEKALGLSKVKARLRGMARPGGEVQPMLMVSSDCTLTIRQAHLWMLGANGEPEKKHDDTWEGIYRIVNLLPDGGRTAKAARAHAGSYRSSLVVD